MRRKKQVVPNYYTHSTQLMGTNSQNKSIPGVHVWGLGCVQSRRDSVLSFADGSVLSCQLRLFWIGSSPKMETTFSTTNLLHQVTRQELREFTESVLSVWEMVGKIGQNSECLYRWISSWFLVTLIPAIFDRSYKIQLETESCFCI